MSDKPIIEVQSSMRIKLPTVPNFLRPADANDDTPGIPLCCVSDDCLRDIAYKWTEALLETAKRQHKARFGTERKSGA